MILSPNQQKILDELLPVAHLATNNPCYNLPLQPRTHSLICAPSGMGKSYLMKQLGNKLNVPVLLLNVSSWQPLGSREHTNTWSTIVDFLKAHERGIIVLDELDKLDSDESWVAYVRLEIHDLLDGVIPPALDLDTDDDGWDFSSDDI
jgi:AAA+ superfamily predicted ATPase